jgi:hypothetical protein
VRPSEEDESAVVEILDSQDDGGGGGGGGNRDRRVPRGGRAAVRGHLAGLLAASRRAVAAAAAASGRRNANRRGGGGDGAGAEIEIVGGVSVAEAALRAANETVENPALADAIKCAICMDSIAKNEMASTTCGHVFCVGCIERAFQGRREGKCPTCRKTRQRFHRIFV